MHEFYWFFLWNDIWPCTKIRPYNLTPAIVFRWPAVRTIADDAGSGRQSCMERVPVSSEPSGRPSFMTASKPDPGHELDILGAESDCSYLPGRQSLMHYRVALSLSPGRYETLLARGWRRFGRTMFRPVCRQCSECRSLRVDINGFQPSKSQRRIARRNSDVQLTVATPTITDEHLQLYDDYHADMHERRGWPYSRIDEEQYLESFVDGNWPFAREFQYRLDGRLVGLGLVDMTGSVMSSIYFVHAPDVRARGLGTASVLREIEAGQQTNHRWLYMGYYIRECDSMNYKDRYRPHQILQDYVSDDESPIWSFPS